MPTGEIKNRDKYCNVIQWARGKITNFKVDERRKVQDMYRITKTIQ